MNTRIVKVSSSFVSNKLKIITDRGSGEAKIFIGSTRDEVEIDNFFNNFSTENEFILEKNSLVDYLKKSYVEYALNIINKYKQVDEEYFNIKLDELEDLPDVIKFNMEKFADSSRYYIRAPKQDKTSNEIVKKYIRELALPKITDLIIEKNNNQFSFRLELNLNNIQEGEIEAGDIDNIECHSDLIKHKNIQDLYFGAPGTGKSYEVSQLIKTIYPTVPEKENPFVFKTTIYSDYSYYDFIGNLVPKHDEDGQLGYGFTPGVFTQALAQALKYEDKEIFLVVEEMSRGNIASIFGDIFQLLDRDEEGKSEYSINNDLITSFLNKPIEEGGIGKELKKISLPRNLHIIGTVNTSDQNVNVIDTAFKRRFGFVYSDVEPIKDENDHVLNSFDFELDGQKFEWNRFYMSLNSFITGELELSEDKQIGQFFIKFGNFQNDEERYEAIQNKLLHYLWEDVQSMAIDESKSIFNKGHYKTFSQLYKGFKNRENIFSEDLVKLYDKTASYTG